MSETINLQQRWLYWDVPSYLAAMWVRCGKDYMNEDVTLVWHEVQLSTGKDDWLGDCLEEVRNATALMVDVNEGNYLEVAKKLPSLRNSFERYASSQGNRGFLVVSCLDCDDFLWQSFLELGADFVIRRIDQIPSLSSKIAKFGKTFPAIKHPFLGTPPACGVLISSFNA